MTNGITCGVVKQHRGTRLLYPSSVPERPKLKPQVVLLGIVALLNDSASEMIYPLLPVFLTMTLGASPTADSS